MTKKAVVLLSGGLDSTTCLAIAKDRGFETYALSFDYGQRHRAELTASEEIAKLYGAKEHKIVKLSIGELGGSALTDDDIAVPDYNGSGEIPVTYVPARNTVFLSIALGWAEVLKAYHIFIGVSVVDYSGYPDCRPEFIAAFERMANLATKDGVEGKCFTLEPPLMHLSKAETILLGNTLGVDYAKTISCYQANDLGQACGSCDSCELRRQGFIEAGLADATLYA